MAFHAGCMKGIKIMNELETKILEVMFRPSFPMMSIYEVCKRLGTPQSSSTNRGYARVYRAMERLVEKGYLQVMRGTRDVSVYLAVSNIKRTRK